MSVRVSRLVTGILLFLALLITAGCGSGGNSGPQGGVGSIAAQLLFSSDRIVPRNLSSTMPPNIITMKVTISGPGMSDIVQLFYAGNRSGTISDVPAGVERIVRVSALDALGAIMYEGVVEHVTVTAGQTTSVVTVIMYAALDHIEILPGSANVIAGFSQQFTAKGYYADGVTFDITQNVTWSSSNESVATITSSGLATGVAGGTATITASNGTVTGTAFLGVTSTGTLTIFW
ncbi:hypothetical protein GMSM_33050 [Geomonas sp. Red276]